MSKKKYVVIRVSVDTRKRLGDFKTAWKRGSYDDALVLLFNLVKS
jgi:hypothetical protein